VTTAVRLTDAWRPVLVLSLAAVIVVLPYAVGVLLPYYVNDLDQLPLSEVASGRHDPKDLWPQGPIGGLVQLSGFLALALTPMGLVLVGLASAAVACLAVVRRKSPAVVLAYVLLTTACVAALAWFTGPTAAALATWRLD
jgi:hypothetical protein